MTTSAHEHYHCFHCRDVELRAHAAFGFCIVRVSRTDFKATLAAARQRAGPFIQVVAIMRRWRASRVGCCWRSAAPSCAFFRRSRPRFSCGQSSSTRATRWRCPPRCSPSRQPSTRCCSRRAYHWQTRRRRGGCRNQPRCQPLLANAAHIRCMIKCGAWQSDWVQSPFFMCSEIKAVRTVQLKR